MRTRKTLIALLSPALVAVSWLGFGIAGSYADQGSTCSPNGTALSISAFDGKFDKKCLAAPANQAVTIKSDFCDESIESVLERR